MSNDEQHVALPKLYGAPAYARPPRSVVEPVERPVDPDDLQIEAHRSTDDDAFAAIAVGQTGDAAAGGQGGGPANGHPRIEARPFSLRSLSRFISGRS